MCYFPYIKLSQIRPPSTTVTRLEKKKETVTQYSAETQHLLMLRLQASWPARVCVVILSSVFSIHSYLFYAHWETLHLHVYSRKCVCSYYPVPSVNCSLACSSFLALEFNIPVQLPFLCVALFSCFRYSSEQFLSSHNLLTFPHPPSMIKNAPHVSFFHSLGS